MMAVRWDRIGQQVKLDCELWQAALDLDQPERGWKGWHHPRFGAVDAQLLGVSVRGRPAAAWPLLDAYPREMDYSISYGPTVESPYTLELVYSAGHVATSDGSLPVIDLVVSVQTHLLDTHPVVSVTSHCGPARLLAVAVAAQPDAAHAADARISDACSDLGRAARPVNVWQFPWGQSGLVYLEMAHPDDLPAEAAPSDATAKFAHRLFAEFLEKGVIRRARLRGALVPEHEAPRLAGRLVDAFLARPLPLSA